MFNTHAGNVKYIFAAIIGAAAGGLVVALTARAVPKMGSEMMAGIMHKMMSKMEEVGCEQEDMCKRMMASTGHAPERATCQS